MSESIEINDARTVQSLADGLANLATGLGTSKDKAVYNNWYHSGKNLDIVGLAARFREDWVSQKVCQIIPQDLTREWRTFESDDASDADDEWAIADKFREAHKWARLYGTSFIILDIADNRSTDKPVNWKNLKPGCLRSLIVVDRTRVVATGSLDTEPMSETYGMPTSYTFVNSTTEIHRDRIIRFEGTELPIYERQRNLWYSDSILIPLMPQIDNFHVASHAAAQMVQEANTDIIRIEGLQNILQNDSGTNAMLQRFTDWKTIKSVFGVSILDGSEEYEQKSIQLSGVKDLIWEYLKIVAASVSIPATRFLSASPDGMNATGESDLVNYIETLKGLHRAVYDPRLVVIDKLLAAHYGLDINEFKYEWACMFPESASEKAARDRIDAETLQILTDSGIISRESALQEAIDRGMVLKTAALGELLINKGDTDATAG